MLQGSQVPEFSLAFQSQVGYNPSIDEMMLLVARKKARPLFPNVWKDSNPAVKLLKETIEYCWDQVSQVRGNVREEVLFPFPAS